MPQCPGVPFRPPAKGGCAPAEYSASVLSAADKQFLRGLLSCAWRQVDSTNFFLCHATPSDLLYEYRPPASPLWDREEEASLGANFVVVGIRPATMLWLANAHFYGE